MTNKLEKLKELKQLLNDNSLTEAEYNKMKAELIEDEQKKVPEVSSKRTGIGWQEVVGVLFGPLSAFVYLILAKQNLVKKISVLVISFLVLGFYASLSEAGNKQENLSASNTTSSPNTPSPDQPQENLSASNTTSSPNTPSPDQPQKAIAVNVWSNIREDRAIQVNDSEVVNQINTGNQFMEPVRTKGGKLVVVYMTLKNTGNESGDMFWTDFKLTDNQGRTYKEIEDFEETMSINSWLENHGLGKAGNQIYPGGIAKTAKVFRTASDASNMKLVANDKLFNIQ